MFRVTGGKELSGSVKVSGAKNAALPILAVGLFMKHVTLRNVPRIGDIFSLIDLLKSMGSEISFEKHTLIMNNTHLSLEGLDEKTVKKLRASIMILAPLLSRYKHVALPYPGGCNLGKRSIQEHIQGFVQLGYEHTGSDTEILLSGTSDTGEKELFAGFSVTATENLLAASILRSGKTRLLSGAIEPHVINFMDFLNACGARITLCENNIFEIEGVKSLKDSVEFSIIPDYLESWAFAIIGALISKTYIDIHEPCFSDLRMFFYKLEEMGVCFEHVSKNILRVYRAHHLKPVNIQTNIHPGFPTDLQSPFSILMTQAEGMSRIHEILFESRLNWLVEIEKMKGQIALLNPHQAMIFGPTQFRGTTLSSWDIRAGIAVLIAALIAQGESKITNIHYTQRGYEDILTKLKSLGADIYYESDK